MNDAERSEDVNGTAPNENGVLANLPRARPQRSSARRLAARETTASSNGSGTALSDKRATARRPAAATGKAARKPVRRRASKATGSVAPIGESAASATAKSTVAKGTAASAPTKATPSKAKKPAKRATAGTTRKRAHSTPQQEPAPRQGFECESDAPTGSVQPPGGVELVASAAELVGELAKAGLSRSVRLLKDVVSLLPLS